MYKRQPKIGLDWDDVTAPFNSIAIDMANKKYNITPPLTLDDIDSVSYTHLERIVGVELAKDIVKAYLTAEFEGGRHAKRVAMILALLCCFTRRAVAVSEQTAARIPLTLLAAIEIPTPVSYTHLDVYKRQGSNL